MLVNRRKTLCTIPVLHPVLVHFPIAFLLLAALAAVAWLGWGTRFWRDVTLLLLVAGFLGGLGAYFTGEAVEERAKAKPLVQQFGEQHESFALLTLVVSGLALFALAAYIGASRRLLRPGDRDLPAVRVVVAVLAVASAVLVARTGHLGGLMVWGQPVGSVQQQAPQQTPQSGEGEERHERE